MNRRTAPAPGHRGLPWWGRLLLLLAVEAALLGLAWQRRDDDPYGVFGSDGFLPTAAWVVLPLTVALAGPGRWPVLTHGLLVMVGAVAVVFGVPGVVTLYREQAARPVTATLVSLDPAANRVVVRLPGGAEVDAFRNGGGPTAAGGPVTVHTDPAGLLTPDNAPLQVDGTGRAAQVVGLVALGVWQVAVFATLFRRRDWSTLQRYGGGDGPAVPR